MEEVTGEPDGTSQTQVQKTSGEMKQDSVTGQPGVATQTDTTEQGTETKENTTTKRIGAEELVRAVRQEGTGHEEQTDGQGVRDDGGRDDRMDPGGQIRGVEENGSQQATDPGTDQNEERNRQARLRAEEFNRRIVRYSDLTQDTLCSAIVKDGDGENYVAVVPENLYDEEMKIQADNAVRAGASEVIVVKGALWLKTNGETKKFGGYYEASTGKIVVTVNSTLATPGQLIAHESFHLQARTDQTMVERITEHIRENFSQSEFDAIVERYMQIYGELYQENSEAIYEEILADAYAGVNRFGDARATTYTEAVRSQVEGTQTGRENAAALRRSGTGDDGNNKYSYGGEKAKTADLTSLQEAKQLQEMGADMESIRLATGWHQMQDGKWRFEINDSGAEFHRDGDARFVQEQGYQRLQKLTEKWAESFSGGEALTEAESAEMERLQGEYEDRVWEEKYMLTDFLKHDALFQAYPRLKGVSLAFDSLDGGTKG